MPTVAFPAITGMRQLPAFCCKKLKQRSLYWTSFETSIEGHPPDKDGINRLFSLRYPVQAFSRKPIPRGLAPVWMYAWVLGKSAAVVSLASTKGIRAAFPIM